MAQATAQAAIDALAQAVADAQAQADAQAANVPTAFQAAEGLTHYAFPTLLAYIKARTQPYLCGPSGSGKTHAAGQVAQVLGARTFRFMSCHAEMGPHAFFGYMDAHGNYSPGIIRDAWEHGGLVLIDEMDACNANALAGLNGALALGPGKCYTFPDGENIPRHPDFYVICAGNTNGHGADDTYVGREQLDGATLSRFVFLAWDYDENLERAMVPSEHGAWVDRVQALRKAAKAAGESLLITPRATEQGAALLAVGLDMETVEHATVWKGAPEDTRRTVLAHV